MQSIDREVIQRPGRSYCLNAVCFAEIHNVENKEQPGFQNERNYVVAQAFGFPLSCL